MPHRLRDTTHCFLFGQYISVFFPGCRSARDAIRTHGWPRDPLPYNALPAVVRGAIYAGNEGWYGPSLLARFDPGGDGRVTGICLANDAVSRQWCCRSPITTYRRTPVVAVSRQTGAEILAWTLAPADDSWLASFRRVEGDDWCAHVDRARAARSGRSSPTPETERLDAPSSWGSRSEAVRTVDEMTDALLRARDELIREGARPMFRDMARRALDTMTFGDEVRRAIEEAIRLNSPEEATCRAPS